MIEIKNLSKTYSANENGVEALKNVSLTINDGEIFGIIGMSGAGKSTLVRCINMLERPTDGTVIIDGTDLGSLSPKELRAARRKIAMIFQSFNLLLQRTCLQNVCFPLELAGVKKEVAKKRALELLELVGLPEKANVYPAKLSGGQQQRVAIARALASDPKILLCDEATSALDPETTRSILKLIREINEKLHITVVLITHQMNVVEICDRMAILDGGVVAEEGAVGEVFVHPKSAAARQLIFPDGCDVQNVGGERLLRVVFNGASAAGSPLIATLAMEKHIAVNILSASTRIIANKTYGNMLLGIPDDGDTARQATEFFNGIPDVIVEEVTANA